MDSLYSKSLNKLLELLREHRKALYSTILITKECIIQYQSEDKVWEVPIMELPSWIQRRSCHLWKSKDLEVQFSCSVESDSLQPHGLKHARLSHPSPTPWACSNSCPSSRWWTWWLMPSNHFILCHPRFLLPSVFPSIRVFSSELILYIRWPKYWSFSFSISRSKEHPGLISFINVLYYFQIFNIFDIFQDANNFSITICSLFSGI